MSHGLLALNMLRRIRQGVAAASGSAAGEALPEPIIGEAPLSSGSLAERKEAKVHTKSGLTTAINALAGAVEWRLHTAMHAGLIHFKFQGKKKEKEKSGQG